MIDHARDTATKHGAKFSQTRIQIPIPNIGSSNLTFVDPGKLGVLSRNGSYQIFDMKSGEGTDAVLLVWDCLWSDVSSDGKYAAYFGGVQDSGG